MSLCILVPVYHPYRWLAPFMNEFIGRNWANHPPIFFCGMTPEEAGELPALPLRNEALPRDWCALVLDAVSELQGRGFSRCYLLLEEHLPLATCHAPHLNDTLPGLLDEIGAGYIGLMGWDNRRYSTRAPVLGRELHRLMHLITRDAPRFHLHPSLWRLDTLQGCLELTLRESVHTPWRFEKVSEKADADLPVEWKRGCYQICGSALAAAPPGRAALAARRAERFIFHKLMALYPHIRRTGLGPQFWRLAGFDNYYYNGPYPMFFSGVMSKGAINSPFVRFMRRDPARCADLARILCASENFSTHGQMQS